MNARALPPRELPDNIAHLSTMRNWIAWERVKVLNDDGTVKLNVDGTPKISKKPRTASEIGRASCRERVSYSV